MQLRFDKFRLGSFKTYKQTAYKTQNFRLKVKCTELVRTLPKAGLEQPHTYHKQEYLDINDLVNKYIGNLGIKLEQFRQ